MKLSVAFLVFVSLNAVQSHRMNCVFTMTFDNLYSCTNHNLNIEKNAVEIKQIDGHHMDNKQNEDVSTIYFLSAGMKRLPRNIFKMFPNLSKYIVHGLDTVSDFLDSGALVRGDFWNGKSLRSVVFTSVVLEELRAKVFEGAEDLLYLTLEACHITVIEKNTFKGLTKLQSLGLKYNYITHLDVTTFADLGDLQHLLLSGNFLTTITRNHLKHLTNLSRLAMIGNLLIDVESNVIEDLKELEFLYLDQNVCIDEHFGTDGVPFSKFEKSIAKCSKNESTHASLKRKEIEIQQLEREIATLQRLVEKYRTANCHGKSMHIDNGKLPWLKIKEMP